MLLIGQKRVTNIVFPPKVNIIRGKGIHNSLTVKAINCINKYVLVWRHIVSVVRYKSIVFSTAPMGFLKHGILWHFLKACLSLLMADNGSDDTMPLRVSE
jgi:hypothetical protein